MDRRRERGRAGRGRVCGVVARRGRVCEVVGWAGRSVLPVIFFFEILILLTNILQILPANLKYWYIPSMLNLNAHALGFM
jgi:hypothetical protein